MTTRTFPTPGRTVPTPSERTHLLWGGIFFILTFVTSIPALLLYDPILKDADFVFGAGSETRIQWAAILEVGLIVSNVATAVVLFPVLKRFSEGVALGYVAARVFESAMIAVGVMALLSVLTLRQDLAGTADVASLSTTSASLVALHEWTFLFGPAFCAAIGTGVLLGYLMYRSGFIPRRVALLGLIGGPIALINPVGVVFGAWEQVSAFGFLLTSGEIAWEMTFGIWMVVLGLKGRRPAAKASLELAQAS
jgi:hypothetical protein